MKRALLIFLPLIAVIGWWLWRQFPVSVTAEPVRLGRIVEIVYASGIVKPGQELLVDAKVSGQLKTILVKEGQFVKAGQVIAIIDAFDFEMKLHEAERRLRVAQAQFKQLKAGTDLFDIASLQAEYDASLAQWKIAQAEVESAQTLLREAKIHYQQAVEALKLTQEEVRSIISQAEQSVRIATAKVNQAQSELKIAQANAELVAEGARKEEKLQAQAVLDSAKVSCDEAKRNLERSKKLFDEGAISKADLESAQTRYELTLSQLQQAEANWQKLQTGARKQEQEAAESQVLQALSVLESAQAQLDQSKAKLQSAQSNERQINLKKAEVELSLAQIRQAESAVRKAKEAERMAKAKMKALSARLSQAKRGARPEALKVARYEYETALQIYQDAKLKLNDFVVRSPVDGIVTEVVAKAGVYIAVGFGMSTIVKMSTGEDMFIEAQVDEADIGKVRLGCKAYFKADAYPEVSYRTIVTRIHPEADKLTKTYRVELRQLQPKKGLKLGMSGDVNIESRSVSNALLVPPTAVMTDSNSSVVWVVDNKRAYKRTVQVGVRDVAQVHIKSGLRNGEIVITNPPSSLRNGQTVRVRK